jgi:cytochrome c biogenesis protein
MTAEARPASSLLRPGGVDPLRFAWNLLTNVKFALLLVGLAGVVGLIGTVVPQLPAQMRDNPAAQAAWIEIQRDTFGAFTDPMRSLGLFEVFYSRWFTALWAVIIVSVTVCTVSRFRPTMRSVRRPPKSVGDRYFETAHHRASFSHPGGVEAVEGILRRRRFSVERVRQEDGEVHLFAERYPWTQYGTFLSHLALLMLLIGGLLTFFVGFDRTLVIAETTPAAPIFDQPGPGQMFVTMVDAHRGIDDDGNVIDFHSIVEVRRGDEVITCKTTVNTPCSAFGYKVHQAAFFDDIARLKVVGPGGGVPLFNDILDFENRETAVPHLTVTDSAGNILFDQLLPQMATEPGNSPGPEDDYALAVLAFPGAVGAPAGDLVSYAVAWQVISGRLDLTIAGNDLAPEQLSVGQSVAAGDYTIRFTAARNIPALRVADMPGAVSRDGGVIVQMPEDRHGNPYLYIVGIDTINRSLVEGQEVVTTSGYRYTFGGRVEASGLSVRRDPGDSFIWLAVGMAMVGLGITFYVPRRRVWVKVTAERTYLAGVAERTTRFSRELRLLGAELGSTDALLPEDQEQAY